MQNGKGSKPRPYSDYSKYSENWDDINFGIKEKRRPWVEKTKNKKLSDLTEHEFNTLKEMGYLWEFFPEATGDYKRDCI